MKMACSPEELGLLLALLVALQSVLLPVVLLRGRPVPFLRAGIEEQESLPNQRGCGEVDVETGVVGPESVPSGERGEAEGEVLVEDEAEAALCFLRGDMISSVRLASALRGEGRLIRRGDVLRRRALALPPGLWASSWPSACWRGEGCPCTGSSWHVLRRSTIGGGGPFLVGLAGAPLLPLGFLDKGDEALGDDLGDEDLGEGEACGGDGGGDVGETRPPALSPECHS